jgi:CheY-like chemotaxis protein
VKSRKLSSDQFDRKLATRLPLNFLVVEDNKINRKLLVQMLAKLGYTNVSEAYDGNNAVEQMRKERSAQDQIDVVLMDLWMPLLDGFQAAEAIFEMELPRHPTILAVSADLTASAVERAGKVGMKGFLGKPFQLRELEKLIVDNCAARVSAAA